MEECIFDGDLLLERIREQAYAAEVAQLQGDIRNKNFTPSELVCCIRRIVLRRINAPVNLKRIKPYMWLMMMAEVGKTVHKYVQSIYPFTDVEKKIESKKYNIRGRVDGIAKKRSVVEIKTLDDAKINPVSFAAISQAALCAQILNDEYPGYNICEIVILQAPRSCKNLIPRKFLFNDKAQLVAQNMYEKSIMVKEFVQRDQIPPMNHKYVDKQYCYFCVYRDICAREKR
jgi:CRISPR/Cas system-associated exonuclease Cas4 (RecB family)